MLTTGAAGGFFLVGTTESRADAQIIRQYTLNGLSRLTGLQPTHVKIDVESFEREVLDGGAELLAAARPILFLELHRKMLMDRGIDPVWVVKRVREIGYPHVECAGVAFDEHVCSEDIVRLVCWMPEQSGG
jgi:hypothetical protein